MKIFLYVVLFFVCITSSQFVGAQAWVEQRPWNGMETELEYAKWFKENFTTDFYFKKTGLLEGKVGVDCAKAAYVARAVFAFQKGLRFYAIGRDGGVIDSSVGKYKGSTPEEVLRYFLREQVVGRTNVESMKDNTFPIAVDRSRLTSGTVFNFQMPGFENNEAGRHAYIVKDITDGGYIKFIWATVPIANRILTELTLYPTYLPTNVSILNQWGFRRFYQPQDYLDGLEKFKKILSRRAGTKASTDEDSLTPDDVEQRLVKLLGDRGYSSTKQNELAAEVLLDYEREKENLRYINTQSPEIKKFVFNKPAAAEGVDYSSLVRRLPIRQTYMSAPGFRPRTVIDEIEDRRRSALDDLLNPKVSAVDKIIQIAQEAAAAEELKKRRVPRLVRNISVPPLIKNGFFVSDPDVLFEGLSVISIYHGKLVTLLQKNEGIEETLEQNLQRQYFNLCSYLENRVAAVEEGYNYFFRYQKIVSAPNTFNRCPTQEEFYNYTTPNRDSEFKGYLTNLRRFYLANREDIKQNLPEWFYTMEYSLGEPMHPQYFSLVTIANQTLENSLDYTKQFLPKGHGNKCIVDIDFMNGSSKQPLSIRNAVPLVLKSYTLKDVKGHSVSPNLISPMPYVSIARRWGFEPLTQDVFLAESNIKCDLVKEEEAATTPKQ
jgi:hypothetical protein